MGALFFIPLDLCLPAGTVFTIEQLKAAKGRNVRVFSDDDHIDVRQIHLLWCATGSDHGHRVDVYLRTPQAAASADTRHTALKKTITDVYYHVRAQ